MILQLLAQSNAWGNDRAQMMLGDSLELARLTAQSWERIWNLTIAPTSPLWQTGLYLGGLIFYLYVIVQLVQGLDRGMSFAKEMLGKVLVSGLFLMGNGSFSINIFKLMQRISQYFTTLVLQFTIADVKISEAIGRIQNTSVAKARTTEIFAECLDKIGIAVDECINDPVKLDSAADLLNSFSGNEPLQGTILEQLANGVTSNLTAIISLPVLSGIQKVSNIVQWCFMNIYESTIIITVLLFPIFLGLSMAPHGVTTLGKWFGDLIKLLLFPVVYALMVGLVGVLIAGTEFTRLPLGATFLDTGYALFIGLFAPAFAWWGINKGAAGIYEATTSAAKNTVETGVTVASAGANLPAQVQQIKALGG